MQRRAAKTLARGCVFHRITVKRVWACGPLHFNRPTQEAAALHLKQITQTFIYTLFFRLLSSNEL
jgi:hypothetical protein